MARLAAIAALAAQFAGAGAASLRAGCGSKSCAANAGACPTDNAAATLYGAGAYPWTDEINWACVYNVKDYSGSPDAAFAAAQADAVKGGGGVVYFPAGSYTFTANLQLASGVVIRGAPTTAPAKVGKLPGPLAPATKFTCPDRQHTGILNADPAASNLGVVNIAGEGCAVMLWPGLTPAISAAGAWPAPLKAYWFGATAVAGQGSNKLAIGNVLRDVAYGWADPTAPPASTNPLPWRFGHAMAVYSANNSLVANNQLPASTKDVQVKIALQGDKVQQRTVRFQYDQRYGLDNKLLLGGVAGKATSPGGACASGMGELTPQCAPWAFPLGVAWRDNWAFNEGRVSYNFYGGCPDAAKPALGDGAQILDNHSEHAPNSTFYSADGKRVAGGSDTNENRGYDSDLQCGNVTGNTAHVYRQHTLNGYESVDGECILTQTSNGYHNLVSTVWANNDCTHDDQSNPLRSGYILYYKAWSVSNGVIRGNKVDADQSIGGLFDAQHDGWSGMTCSGNTPAATVCGPNGCKPC